MGGTLTIARGTSRDFLRQVRDSTGEPFVPVANPSPFFSTDTLAAKVWAGADLPAVVTPAVAWVDATTATYRLSLADADTAALDFATYRLRVTAARGGRTGVIDDAELKVTRSPGAGSALLAFTTLADLLTYCPWIEGLQDDVDQAGFEGEQARATAWLIDALVSAWRPGGGYGPTIGQPGYGPSTMGGSAGSAPSYWLRQQITPLLPGSTPPASMPDRASTPANLIEPRLSTALLLYPAVKECCARRAVSYVLDAQVGRNSDKEWWALAGKFAREASGIFRATRFEVDLSNPQTGWAGVVIEGGASRA